MAAPSLNVELLEGLIMFTTGGLFPELTVIETEVDVVAAFLSSIAFTVKVWVPLGTLFQANV
jgi:hypothetical protein